MNNTAKFLERVKLLDLLKFSNILESLVPSMFSEPPNLKLDYLMPCYSIYCQWKSKLSKSCFGRKYEKFPFF